MGSQSRMPQGDFLDVPLRIQVSISTYGPKTYAKIPSTQIPSNPSLGIQDPRGATAVLHLNPPGLLAREDSVE